MFGFGAYRLSAHRHARGGMQVGALDLTLWSFLMATAHGAGLMLVPVLLRMPMGPGHHSHGHAVAVLSSTAGTAVAAVAVHTLAMLAVALLIAVAVYDRVGLAFLRRGWINFDLVWALALVAAGAILLVGVLA